MPEYWVADPDARTVEVYRLHEGSDAPKAHARSLRRQPDPAVPALDVALSEVFRDF